MELDQRKRLILSAIVSAYIETGEPVGSKTLLIRENLGVSPATIRNEMSELERLGYLKKTHTSSGRVPSNLGYRFYVGTLTPYRLTKKERETLNSSLENSAGFEELLEASTQNLANFSGCTVFGISPNCPDGIYQFEVLPAGKRILAIMVIASGGSVKNYFYRATEDVSLKDASILTKIFNTVFAGFPIDQIGTVRMLLLEHEIKTHCPKHIGIVDTVKKLLAGVRDYELHIGGTENLLSYPEFSDIETARGFVGMLSTRQQILEALLATHPTDEIEIRIGAENGLFNSPHASLITLFSDHKFPVMLGLMGPTRMDYARTIAGCNHVLSHLKTFIEREY